MSALDDPKAVDPCAGAAAKHLSRRGDVAPFIAMDLMREANALAADGHEVVRMEVGQPGTQAPRRARERVAEALKSDPIGYTNAAGLPELREAIARLYETRYGLTVPPERVLITTGSSAGFVLTFLALFDAGQTVALPSPGYPCYRQILSALGISPALLPVDDNSHWMPTPAMLADHVTEYPLHGLLLASPANPTGTMLRRDALAGLLEACTRHGVHYISDEIYHGLTYDEPAASALEFTDDVVVVNSFSKYYSMTGWRIGWLVVPEDMVRRFERLQQHLFISAPAISQYAALGALQAVEELEAFKADYARNRRVLLEGLADAGIRHIAPADGAFYLYADVSDFTDDALAFAGRLLHEAHVAATPGLDFDPDLGHKFLRLSYAATPDCIELGLERIARFLRSLRVV